ncbi:MAG: hypothetical protein ACK47B_24745 [Armatimonadota bacterium]
METGKEGAPRVVTAGTRQAVVRVHDEWRVEDEWWRQPISRRYFRVTLEDGRCLTLFHDTLVRRWYRQHY